MPSIDPKLDDLACFSVYTAGHAFNRVYKPLLDPLGLTYPQYLVMIVLWEEDGPTVGRLGERLSLESSTLTPLLKRMEAAGFVSRERDPTDERQVRVRLTARGRALQDEAAAIPGCILAATGKSVEDLIRLKAEIDGLRAALEKTTAG